MTPDQATSTISTVLNLIGELVPEAQAPLTLVNVLVRDAAGVLHLKSTTEEALATLQAREQSAGAAANRASHLVGLREAIEHLVSQWSSSAPSVQAIAVDAIMAEVVKRMP